MGTGGAGGVGAIAQQLARHMFGAAEVEAIARAAGEVDNLGLPPRERKDA